MTARKTKGPDLTAKVETPTDKLAAFQKAQMDATKELASIDKKIADLDAKRDELVAQRAACVDKLDAMVHRSAELFGEVTGKDATGMREDKGKNNPDIFDLAKKVVMPATDKFGNKQYYIDMPPVGGGVLNDAKSARLYVNASAVEERGGRYTLDVSKITFANFQRERGDRGARNGTGFVSLGHTDPSTGHVLTLDDIREEFASRPYHADVKQAPVAQAEAASAQRQSVDTVEMDADEAVVTEDDMAFE